MTQANKQTTTQSTAHFGAKATVKATAKPTAKPEPVKTRRISREKFLATLDAIREKDQPVLDYLKDK